MEVVSMRSIDDVTAGWKLVPQSTGRAIAPPDNARSQQAAPAAIFLSDIRSLDVRRTRGSALGFVRRVYAPQPTEVIATLCHAELGVMAALAKFAAAVTI